MLGNDLNMTNADFNKISENESLIDSTSSEEIDVSFVMTVYNKEFYLPAVLKALLNQTGLKNPQYIFVDDLSRDRSVQIIEEMTKDVKNVIILKKDKNEGISISINKGIALAQGKWIRMLDSDDIFPLNSTEKMIEVADKHQADMVYGTFTKTGKEPMDIAAEYMPNDFRYNYNPNALKAVLGGHFTRMGQLIKRSVLQEAGGADTRVFIQDESIPLRASRLAQGIIKMDAHVVLVPRETNNLSKNTHQLDNDRFFAHYYFLKDYQDTLPRNILAILFSKALSDNWKFVKKNLPHPYFTADFYLYLLSKVFPLKPDFNVLDKMAERFLSLSDVLRSKP